MDATFFKKGNNSSPDDIIRTEQEVLAMTEYLFNKSKYMKKIQLIFLEIMIEAEFL